jgi:hypothetical protein
MHLVIKNDPNKATTTTLVLTAKSQKMIDQLKPILGVKSREAVLLKGLEALHKHHFVR